MACAVIAPTELLHVAEALKPYLQTQGSTPQTPTSTPVEIYSPDEVTEELLENHNLQHPKNAELFCLVVTALSNEALRYPPDFTEMPGNYLIYQDGKPVKVGFQRPRTWL